MARVEDSGQSTTRREGLNHNFMHNIVNDVSILLIIDRINDFVIPITLVAIQIFSLATMSRIMEEQ